MSRSSLGAAPLAFVRTRTAGLAAICVVLALGLFVWPLLLDIPLLDPDEGLHASIAQEMLERGEWISPSFLGQAFFDKPILYFWALIASMAAFGQSEAAVRLPSLCFGALGALATALLARDLFGSRVGLIAGVMQATMLGPLAQSQAGGHDVALVPCTTFALLWLRRADEATGARAVMALAATSLFLGLSILTKGLAGVALVVIPALAILAGGRRLTIRRLAGLAACVAAAMIVALPWYLLMERAHPGYLYYYFVERHLLGFAAGSARHAGRPWWYYVPVLLAGGFPWVLYLPAAARSATTVAVKSVWTWFVVGLLFLTVAQIKLWTYVLPLFPAIAILGAWTWARTLDDGPTSWAPRPMTWALAVHVLSGALLLPAAWFFGRSYGLTPTPSAALVGCVVAIAAGYAWAVTAFVRREPQEAWLRLSVTLVATVVLTLTLVMPTVARSLSMRDLAEHANRIGSVPARLLVLDDRIGSFVFYLDPEQRRGLTPARLDSVPGVFLLPELAAAPADAVLAVRERRAGVLERALPGCRPSYVHTGQFRLYRVETLQACAR